MSRIQSAMLDFVRLNKRLPCPAAPLLDLGLPVPNGPTVSTANCSNPDGTVPWAVLGLSANDVLDPWGRKISYRVVSGSKTSATVAGGLDRSQCDSEILTAAAPPHDNLPDTITRLCKAPGPAMPRTAITNLTGIPGLIVNDKGTPVSGVAYVLVSHGETGRGAYLPGGQRLLPLPTAGGGEASNANVGTYVVATSNTTVEVDQAAFFDDIVAYELLANLIQKSGLAARDWPDFP